jgi:hypothetical protein
MASWLDTALNYLQENKSEVGLLTGIAGMTGLLDNFTGARNTGPRGYQGSIPKYTVVREPIQNMYDSSQRRPGSRGRRYFTDTRFVDMNPDNQEMGGADNRLSQARLFAAEDAEGIRRAQNTMMAPTEGLASVTSAASPPPSPAPAPASGVANLLSVPTYTMASEFPAPVPVEETQTMAAGGIAELAKGRYLRSSSDGMADKIPATIDKTQPAALSGGEYVIPADVVSHLGNGNSDAGAKILDKMMERIRKARTGNGKQGKEINPNKLLPA